MQNERPVDPQGVNPRSIFVITARVEKNGPACYNAVDV